MSNRVSDLHDDEALVVRLQSGDRSALALLLSRYQRPILGFISGRVRDATLAEDLAQETFLRCVTRVESLREPGAFAGWLFRIAANVCLDHHRRRVHEPEALGELVPADERVDTPSGELSTSLLCSRVGQLVEKLPEKQRIAVHLRHQSGLRCREIAQVMGTTVGSVTKWLSRAYDTLKDQLEEVR